MSRFGLLHEKTTAAIHGSWLSRRHQRLLGAEIPVAVGRVGGRNVPRYFFHFSDGKRQFTDNSGVELSGMAAARAKAIKQVRELTAAMCEPHVQDVSGWTMTVADAKGNSVFKIGFDLKPPRGKG